MKGKIKEYKIIYCDPAWVYSDKSKSHGGGAESHYKCTSIEEMGRMLDNIKISKDSVCLMWCTYPQLGEGLKLMKLWGFTFKTVAFTWIKQNKVADTYFFGMGRYTRGNPEVVLLGKKGKGVLRINAGIPNLHISHLREHSRKPDGIRNKIIELFGDLPRIELFAREKVEGWDVWGDEIDKFTLQSNKKEEYGGDLLK